MLREKTVVFVSVQQGFTFYLGSPHVFNLHRKKTVSIFIQPGHVNISRQILLYFEMQYFSKC